jgi:D-galactarolactone cycloisomerase
MDAGYLVNERKIMCISKIETLIVEQKLAQPFYFSQWAYDTRQVCLVKITDQEGRYGWGEGYGPAGVVEAGIRFLAPFVIGQDPLQVEAIWQHMYRRSVDYARRGVLLASLSALDIALWDLRGKILGQPISVLLGGRRREQIKVYATGMYFVEGADLEKTLAEEAKTYVDQGYQAVKMKVGLGVEADLRNVQAVRQAIGADIQLMVDANHAYSRSEAASLARKIEGLDINFFEEPLSPEDYEGYQELRTRTDIPIAAGECEYLCAGFRHLMVGNCVDIAQPDICAAGGLTEVKRIVSLANTFGVNVIPHSWGTGIAFAAGLHLVSTLDVVPGRLDMPEPMLEMDRTENPLRDRLTVPRFEAIDSKVPVPNQPGLGVDVDPGLLSAFQVALH